MADARAVLAGALLAALASLGPAIAQTAAAPGEQETPARRRIVVRPAPRRNVTPGIRRVRPMGAIGAYGRTAFGPRRAAGSRQRGGNNRAGRTSPRGIQHDMPGTDLELATELAALKGRHDALLPKLPGDIRRLDKAALPLLERLPALPQIAYLTTLEDYSSLSSAETGRLRAVQERLTQLSEADRNRLVESATRTFDAVQRDAAQLKAARQKPHDTYFRLESEVDRLQQPGPKP